LLPAPAATPNSEEEGAEEEKEEEGEEEEKEEEEEGKEEEQRVTAPSWPGCASICCLHLHTQQLRKRRRAEDDCGCNHCQLRKRRRAGDDCGCNHCQLRRRRAEGNCAAAALIAITAK